MIEFITKWPDSELVKFTEDQLKALNLNDECSNLLITTGLPENAAPFLSFETNVSSIKDNYQFSGNNLENVFQIGSDGSGDPVCIDSNNQNQIVICDHENGFKSSFMNSSLLDLFKFLTIMKEFVEHLISERGEDAYMDCDFTDEEHSDLENQYKNLDPKSVETGTFWRNELDRLLEDREYYRNEN